VCVDFGGTYRWVINGVGCIIPVEVAYSSDDGNRRRLQAEKANYIVCVCVCVWGGGCFGSMTGMIHQRPRCVVIWRHRYGLRR
jgi:hypothetical protein